mgnify:FL=1
MKRISRSLLSLCLALLLCASLLPAGLTARADDKTSYLVTGYNAGAYSIETNQTVNIAVSLSRIGGSGTVSRVVRGVDSFRGGDAGYISNVENGTASFMLYNLSYSGTGNSLSFTVYYADESNNEVSNQTFSLTISECVPYTEPEKPTPVEIPEPHAIFSSDAASGSIAAGEGKVISIYIQNVGSTTMRSPMVTVTPSDGLMITDSQSAYTLNDIRPNQSGVVMVSVKAVDKIASASQSLSAKLDFYYDNGTNATASGSASGSVNVPAKVTEDKKDEETIASPTPIVILSKYNYGGSSVAAGSSTNLSFSFTNTSKKLKIENVMLTVTGGTDLMLNGSTNTFYFDSVAAGGSKSVTVPMKAAQLISASAQEVQIAVTYEYVDQNARKSGSASLSLSVPLYQPDRFELSEPKTAYTGYVGEETSLTIDYVNKGKSAINNVEATISGDIDTPTAYQRVGTIDGGKNGTIAFAVTPQLEGENQVKIVITYEDSNGNTKERVFEASVEAMAYEPTDPGMDDPGMIDPEPANTFPWKYVVIAVVAALIVLLVVLRIRKKKAKQKAEQALWDKWDEEEIAEEKKEAADAAAKETAATGAEGQNK